MLAIALGWLASGARAADGQSATEGVNIEVVAKQLAYPTGLAVRPGGSRSGPDLLIAEAGAGRVVGLSSDATPPELVEVLTGFSKAPAAGPRCLAFRSRNRLLVAQSGNGKDPARVSEYDIDDEQLPMQGSASKAIVAYAQGGGDVALAGMGRDDSSLVVTTADHQWLLQATFQGRGADKLERFVKPLDATRVGTPRGVTFSEKGYLLVSLAGDRSAAGDSLIAFLHPVDLSAGPLLVLETGLDEIVALAYSPTSGNLYAANCGSADSSSDGIYRLIASGGNGRDSCKAQLVARVEQPTAMAFKPDGTLYVTTGGAENEPTGELLKLTGDL